MLPASPDHLPDEKSSSNGRSSISSQNGSSPHDHDSDNDMRSSLALFEGEPQDDSDSKGDESAKNGALDLADDASIREFYSQLVSLLTQENAPQAAKPTSRGSLKFALKRRLWPALLITAIALVVFSFLLRPRQSTYTAVADLLLPPRSSMQAGDGLSPPEVSYDTSAQVALISSDMIVADAMEHVPVKMRLAGWRTNQVFAPPVQVVPASMDTNGSLLSIAAPSYDPYASLELVNQVIASYQRYTKNRDTQNRAENLKLARQRVSKTSKDLEEARQARANFKTRTGVTDASAAGSNAATALVELQNNLDAARADRTSVTATDATLTQLTDRLQTAQNDYDKVNSQFFGDSDRVVAAKAQVTQLQSAISARQGQLERQADTKIAQIEASIRRIRDQASTLPNTQLNQDRLDDIVTSRESAYRAATERLNQLAVYEDVVTPLASSLHSPGVGSDKMMKTVRALVISLIAALGLGIVAALLLDRLDGTVRATADPEALWSAPVLGALPATDEANAFFRATPSDQKGNARAKTQNIEACYLTQSNILALAQNSGVRSILFSSSLKSEGKAMSAANIAVALAYGGRETLLIDADFWNPEQHLNFGLPLSPGYAQVLRDQLPLSEAIRPTTINNLYVLTPGQNASEGMGVLMGRLQGQAHAKNLALLKKYFDFIVVDGPTIHTLADAQMAAHLADAVVLVSADDTPRSEVQRARSMLRLSGAFILGVVLNRVRGSEVSEWNAPISTEAVGRRD